MNIKKEYLYAKNDEWARIDGNLAVVGISDYAQSQLSDLVFVEICVSVGDMIAAGDCIATVESVKAASDVYAPVSGKVIAVNEKIVDAPELINRDAFGEAWIIKINADSEFDTAELMDAEAYEHYCESRK